MQFKTKRVLIPVKSQFMDGTLYIPELKKNKLPAIVIFHGRGSSQARYTDRAEELAKAGFITLIFSFRGCGESDDEFSNQTIEMGYQDAIAGYNFLLNQEKIDKDKIGVWGGSYGAYQASFLTQDRSFNSLVLEVPALFKDEWWNIVPESLGEEITQNYRDEEDFADNKAIKVIQNYKGSLLIVKHEFDKVCPEKQTNAFFNHATSVTKKEKVVIKGLGHRLEKENHRAESNKITVDWFKETLK